MAGGFFFCFFGFFGLLSFQFFHQGLGEAEGRGRGLDFGFRGQGAVGLVGDNFVDRFWLRVGGRAAVGLALRLGGGLGLAALEVDGGDLQAVEKQAGAFGVDFVGGDALQHGADGVLDGGAVVGHFQVKAGFAALTGVAVGQVGDGPAGGVVPVAERLVAQRWAAAAVSTGEDVTAVVAFRLWLVWCFFQFFCFF